MDTNSAPFEEFMEAQVEAIMASGEGFEEWIEKHAEWFRKAWEAEHPEMEH